MNVREGLEMSEGCCRDLAVAVLARWTDDVCVVKKNLVNVAGSLEVATTKVFNVG